MSRRKNNFPVVSPLDETGTAFHIRTRFQLAGRKCGKLQSRMPKTKVRKTGADSSLKKGKRGLAASAAPLAEPAAVPPNGSSTELSEKIKELVRLAQEQ